MAATIQNIELPKLARARDTSGNNNHGQIYSGRALEFDGVGDYLSIADDASIRPTDNITVACWIRRNNAADGYETIFGKSNGWTSGVWLSILSGQLRCELDGAISHNDFNSPAGMLELNVWYRIVMTYNTVDGGVLYINGQVVDTVAANGSITQASSTAYQIGGSGSYFLDGSMADFQLWDTAWTAADVTYDYLNPEQTAISGGGTALTESNLKLWYPMQDGHRGQQSYILDGANSGLGVELITNGDFATDLSGWSTSGTNATNTITWETNGARIISTGVNIGLFQNNLIIGKTYRLTCDVAITVGKIGLDGATTGLTVNMVEGFNEIIFTAISTRFKIKRITGNDNCLLDNISVQVINDKHHATTVFHGDELVENGTFATSDLSDFSTTYATQAIVSEELKVTLNTADGYGFSYVTFPAVIGRSYRVQVDAQQGTGSTTNIKHNSGITIANENNAGSWSYDEIGVATATSCAIRLQAYGDSGDYAIFDNVSIKEVGTASGWTDADQQLHIPQTALQSYNELAWFDGTAASNGYVALDTQIATTNNDWSLSFWALQSASGQAYEFIMGGEGTKNIALYKSGGDRTLKYREVTTNSYHSLSDEVIPEDEWVHVVITAIGDTSMTAYINGVVQATNSSMTDTELILDQFMNGFNGSDYTVLGTINEISYYNDVLTAAEALDLFNDGKAKSALEASGSAGLVGYWRNNGLSEWKDLKGSNDGNTSAGVTETMLIPQGIDSSRDSQGFIMNKQKDTSCLNLTWPMYAEISDSDTLDFGTGDFSIECWVKHSYRHTGSAVNTVIALGGDAASASASIVTTATVFRFYVGNGLVNSTVTLVKDNWYHIVGTRTGTTVRLYIDGVVESSTATSSQDLTNSLSKYIGRDSGASRDYKEVVDGVKLYADALSAAEVLRNYKATKGSHRN